jgi:hypothetical protein
MPNVTCKETLKSGIQVMSSKIIFVYVGYAKI